MERALVHVTQWPQGLSTLTTNERAPFQQHSDTLVSIAVVSQGAHFLVINQLRGF